MIWKLKCLLILAGLIFSSLLAQPLSALAEDQSTSKLDGAYADQTYRFDDNSSSYAPQSAEKIQQRKIALEDLRDNLKSQIREKKKALNARQENLNVASSGTSNSQLIAANQSSIAPGFSEWDRMNVVFDNISDNSNGKLPVIDKFTALDNNALSNGTNETVQPSVIAISAAIDAQLLDAIDELAPCYYNSNWKDTISLEQYKTWIAAIAWGEGGYAGYGAHSQCRYHMYTGCGDAADMLWHWDKSSNSGAGDKFRFSTGIGQFQLDRGGYDEWQYWPTIDKLNYRMALISVLRQHSKQFDSLKYPNNANLNDFSVNSKWNAGKYDIAQNWLAVTGIDWETYSGRYQKEDLNWLVIKETLLQNARTKRMSYEDRVKYMGYVQWNIYKSDNKYTDGNKKQIIFDGQFPTWYISAYFLENKQYSYYYTYNPIEKLEIMAYDDNNYKYMYIFARDYSTGAYPENCYPVPPSDDPTKPQPTDGGFTLSHPAIFSLKECRWDGNAGVIISRPYSLKDNQGKNHFFVRGGDSGLWDNEDGTWNGLGGVITSAPCAVMDGTGIVHVFARGGDGALWERVLEADWKSYGGCIAPNSNPSAVLSPDGHIRVAVKGIDSSLWIKDLTTGEWSSLGGIITSNPQIIYDSQGKMHVFVKGGDGALWDSVDGWKCQAGIITSDAKPILNPFKSGFINTYVRGGDGALWVNELNTKQGTATWKGLGGFIKSNGGAPSQPASETGIIEGNPDPVVDADGVIHAFICGGDGSLWDNVNGTWYCLGGGLLSDPNVMRNKDGRINIAVSGTDTALWINTLGLNQVPITLVGPVACDYTRIQDAVNASQSGSLIKVLSGTYKENVEIDESLTIVGYGMGKTIVDGNRSGSVFAVGNRTSSALDVKLSGMTITNGNAIHGGGIFNWWKNLELADCLIAGNSAEIGGGVFSVGTVNLIKCYVYQNNAEEGGGILNHGNLYLTNSIIINNTANSGRGGGISNFGSILKLEGSHILFNNASKIGGGLSNYDGCMMKMNNGSIIFGNLAPFGGGIYNYPNGTVTITDSVIFKNSANVGGGINSYGTATITNSTISMNSANNSTTGAAIGGGIFNGGRATIANSTISMNSATSRGHGGGIYNYLNGTVTITNSMISKNFASLIGGGIDNVGTITITNSIISMNSANNSVNGGEAQGGGIRNSNNGTTVITNSTISENLVIGDPSRYSGGGGIGNGGGTVTITDSTISGNSAPIGGGISNWDCLYLGGTSQITNNQASASYGGGIYGLFTPGAITFDGKNVTVKSNQAYRPSLSEVSWYLGWGVYIESGIEPTMINGFDPAMQVANNTRI